MSQRTTIALVQEVLGADYGRLPDGSLPNLQPYIDSASAMVTQVASMAQTQKGMTLTSTTQELIERWLAAHYYTKMDKTYQSRTTKGASASFVVDQENPEPYRAVAVDIDYSGMLNALLKRQRAGAVWLGKPKSDQIPYDQRD